ncbi:MAG: acetylornithine deacetylase [Acetobacteraceae bacterium]|nr:acetylornithine deacetylase [Acetobacteraceae bacterium]
MFATSAACYLHQAQYGIRAPQVAGDAQAYRLWKMISELPPLSDHPTTTEMLRHLVSFDTTSRNSNLALIDFAEAWLRRNRIFTRRCFSPDGAKANLHAIIGPQIQGGLALSGHVDTVPVDGQAWTSDPFVLRQTDGRLYGRGTCDMKGFVAACLAAAPDIAAMPLSRPVHLFITYDEETTMAGARRLMDDIAESGLRPDICLVGEPSLMQPILAHKGRIAVKVTVRGSPGHSSEPGRGVNAVHAAAEAVAYMAAEARRIARDGPFVDGFDPPYTTAHVGTLAGGTILNIIPESAEFVMEWRFVPGHDADAEFAKFRAYVEQTILPWMHDVDPDTGFSYEVVGFLPGMGLPEDHALAALVKQTTGSNSTGKVSYGTEGGVYEAAGIPSIVCGPGSIQQAHKPDEWIEIAQLDACDAFIRSLVARYAT